MPQIKANNVRDVLLAKGYFPKELPPPFQTNDFGRLSADILLAWKNSGVFSYKPVKKKAGSFDVMTPITESETISVPKHGYARRPISVVHPIAQGLLANEIGNNWRSIVGWLYRQRYSIDQVRVASSYARGIAPLEFRLHQAKISFIEATADWIAKADISRFYHSIYTHSLAWAAYGKEKYKLNPKNYKGSLADRLDAIVRSCNRNQTIGIPVGPETSRILADIISARIDQEIFQVLPADQHNVDRLQDDWFVGTETLESADATIAAIIAAYRRYELDINGEKTSVDRMKAHLAADWVQEILAFLSHRPGELSGQRLRAFLGMILRLQREFEKAPVIGYGISVLEDDKFGSADIEAVESFLLKAAAMSPRAMHRISALLINLHHETKRLSKPRIGDRLQQLAVRNLRTGHVFEATWQLYALRGLKYTVTSKELVELASEISPSVMPLTLLDMRSKGLCAISLPQAQREKRVTPDTSETSPGWLLAYEGIRHGWLSDPFGLGNSRFFAPMLQRNVAFYDDRRNVTRTAKIVLQKRLMQSKQRRRVRLYLSKLRGFTDGTGYE